MNTYYALVLHFPEVVYSAFCPIEDKTLPNILFDLNNTLCSGCQSFPLNKKWIIDRGHPYCEDCVKQQKHMVEDFIYSVINQYY